MNITKNDFNSIRELARQGDAKAQKDLGDCYNKGEGTKRNYAAAAKCYLLSAKQGYLPAQFSLALCYIYGNGVECNNKLAFEWARTAAKQGHAGAQVLLGKFYSDGDYVMRDYETAAKWYRKAIKNGNQNATERLNYLKRNNLILPSNAVKHIDEIFGTIIFNGKDKWICKSTNRFIFKETHFDIELEGTLNEVIASRANKNWHIGDSTYLTLFGEITEVNICASIDEEDDEELTKKEKELLKWLTTELDTETIKQNVIDYCNVCYEMWCDKRIEAEDIIDEVSINSIYLNVKFAEECEHIPEIFLAGECKADEEHGISIGFRNKKLKEISEEGNAF